MARDKRSEHIFLGAREGLLKIWGHGKKGLLPWHLSMVISGQFVQVKISLIEYL